MSPVNQSCNRLSKHIAWSLALDMVLGFNNAGIVIVAFRTYARGRVSFRVRVCSLIKSQPTLPKGSWKRFRRQWTITLYAWSIACATLSPSRVHHIKVVIDVHSSPGSDVDKGRR